MVGRQCELMKKGAFSGNQKNAPAKIELFGVNPQAVPAR